MGGVRGPARRLERHGAECTILGCFRKLWSARDRPPGATRRPSGTLSMRLLLQRSLQPSVEARQSLDFDLDFGSRHTDAVAGDIVMRWRTKDLSRPDVELRTVQRADYLLASDLSLGQRPGVMCASAKNSSLMLNRAICVLFISISRAWPASISSVLATLTKSPMDLTSRVLRYNARCDEHRQCHFCPCPCGCVGPRASPAGYCGAKHCGDCHASLR